MEGLRSQMSSIFREKQRCTEPPDEQYKYSVLEIFRGTNEAVEVNTKKISHRALVSELKKSVSHSPGGDTEMPFLQLLRIRCNQDYGFIIGSENFGDIFSLYGIDPIFLYLYTDGNRRGYYHVRRPDGDNIEGVESSLFHSAGMVLFWSYYPKSRKTFAIACNYSLKTSFLDPYDKLVEILGGMKEAFEYPWYLHLASITERSMWLEQYVDWIGAKILYIEKRISQNDGVSPQNTLTLPELTGVSDWIHIVGARLVTALGQADLTIDLLNAEAFSSCDDDREFGGIDMDLNSSRVQQAKQLAALFRVQIATRKDDISRYQKLVGNQASAIFGLINLNIAESTRKDSASMRIIAVMTMLFLPGTFFATLFAVPSLKWDEDPVITNRFWVYFAFTIPSTLFILGLYEGLDKKLAYRKRFSLLYEGMKKHYEDNFKRADPSQWQEDLP
ncbi:hypothetical protein F4777DRAFT_36093 [Nemania sp. FL0916]|nr:hypothetical protein F4777DRAFT_36093 [Nemania sp. FL0916]